MVMSHDEEPDEAGKLFVGGLSRTTTDESFRSYFETYGALKGCVLMKDHHQGSRSRGFGFVTYEDPTSVAKVLKARPHTLDGKQIDPKPCTPVSIQRQKKMTQHNFSKSHKIFVGGVSMDAEENDLREYFERYGVVTEVVFVTDKHDKTRRHKGFGFVTFEDESSVEQAIVKRFHFIKDKRCEAKPAESREKMDAMKMGGGAPGNHPYQGGNGGSYNQHQMGPGGPQGGYGGPNRMGGGNMGGGYGGMVPHQGGNMMGGGNNMMMGGGPNGGGGYNNQGGNPGYINQGANQGGYNNGGPNNNYPTSYPQQQYGNQNAGGYGCGGYYGQPQQQQQHHHHQQQQQQQQGGNMGGNNMLSNQQPGNQMNQGGYHGGNQLGVNNMGPGNNHQQPPMNHNNNGMGNYGQQPSSYGPMKDYNNMGGNMPQQQQQPTYHHNNNGYNNNHHHQQQQQPPQNHRQQHLTNMGPGQQSVGGGQQGGGYHPYRRT